MLSRVNLVTLALALAWLGLVVPGYAADSCCGRASDLMKELLQSQAANGSDDSAALRQRAAQCPWLAIAEGDGDRAISQFAQVARDNGLAGALRTFARNKDFRLSVAGVNSMSMDAANRYLAHHHLVGTWKEERRGRCADSTLLFAVGEVWLSRSRRYQFAEVWQFDSKVANWGLALLLLEPLAKK